MKHLETYFSKDGISSSQANHVANLVKEKNKVVAAELDRAQAYGQKMSYKSEWLNLASPDHVNLTDLATQEGELYALSAWLREAISARNTLLEYYGKCAASEFGQSVPDFDLPAVPQAKVIPSPAVATEGDILAGFSIKELGEFWALGSKAAHIGKRIHVGGTIANIRNETLMRRDKQTSFTKVDDVSYPVQFLPVYDTEEIDSVFFALQEKHREFESRLNFYKARIQNGMTELNAKRQAEYKTTLAAEQQRYSAALNQYRADMELYNNALNQLSAANEEKRADKLREISAWKIAIPDELKSVYDKIAA